MDNDNNFCDSIYVYVSPDLGLVASRIKMICFCFSFFSEQSWGPPYIVPQNDQYEAVFNSDFWYKMQWSIRDYTKNPGSNRLHIDHFAAQYKVPLIIVRLKKSVSYDLTRWKTATSRFETSPKSIKTAS